MSNEMTRTAPERIYLQVADGGEGDTPFPYGEEITWCEDSIMRDEVAYIRADLAASREKESHGVVTGEVVRVYKDTFNAYLESQMFTQANPADPSAFDVAIRKGLEAVTPLLRGVPEGYALVPIEPTGDMILAGIHENLSNPGLKVFSRIWKAMLAAAIGEE